MTKKEPKASQKKVDTSTPKYGVSIDKAKTWVTKRVSSSTTDQDGQQIWLGESRDKGKTFKPYRKFVVPSVVEPPTPPIEPPSPTPVGTPLLGEIDVLNKSKEPQDHIIQWCNAVKKQCDRDAAIYWGGTVTMNVLGPNELPSKGHWYCGFFENSEQAGVLGWHDVGPNGEPLIKVFTAEAERFGEASSVTLSHEVLETMGDTDANTMVKGTDESGKSCLYFRENCDPVESYTYKIDDVEVSDFVTKSWFTQTAPSPAIYDYLQLCTTPFQILKGGYMQISYDNGKTWNEVDKFSKLAKRHRTTHSRWNLYKKSTKDRQRSTFRVK